MYVRECEVNRPFIVARQGCIYRDYLTRISRPDLVRFFGLWLDRACTKNSSTFHLLSSSFWTAGRQVNPEASGLCCRRRWEVLRIVCRLLQSVCSRANVLQRAFPVYRGTWTYQRFTRFSALRPSFTLVDHTQGFVIVDHVIFAYAI